MQQKYLEQVQQNMLCLGCLQYWYLTRKLHQTQQSSFLRCLLDKFSLFCFISGPKNEGLKRKTLSSAALAPPIPPSHTAVPPPPPAFHPSLQAPAAPSLPPRNTKPSSETMWVNISHKIFIFSRYSAYHFPPGAAAVGLAHVFQVSERRLSHTTFIIPPCTWPVQN